jgi:hypothetical protein
MCMCMFAAGASLGQPVDDVMLGGTWDGSWLHPVSSSDGVEIARAIEGRVVEVEARVDIAVHLAAIRGTPRHMDTHNAVVGSQPSRFAGPLLLLPPPHHHHSLSECDVNQRSGESGFAASHFLVAGWLDVVRGVPADFEALTQGQWQLRGEEVSWARAARRLPSGGRVLWRIARHACPVALCFRRRASWMRARPGTGKR